MIDWMLYRQILETMPIPCIDISIVANGAALATMEMSMQGMGMVSRI